MLTPKFTVEQTDEFVIVKIYAPYVKTSDVDWYVLEDQFKFYVKPYFLRLTFPGQLVEDGRERATYDIDSGQFTVYLPKANAGEHFADLDLQTLLLTKKERSSSVGAQHPPLIEVVDSATVDDGPSSSEPPALDEADHSAGAADEDFDWDWQQTLPSDDSSVSRRSLLSAVRYGFDGKYANVLGKFKTEAPDCVMLDDPDHTPAEERTLLRQSREQADFDDQHYMADRANAAEIMQTVLTRWPAWMPQANDQGTPDAAAEGSFFTEAEQEALRRLPRKELMVTRPKQNMLLLLDVCLACVYDELTTLGEPNPESPWTVCVLSPSLSYLETFTHPREVVVAFVRRSLIYPIYRTWHLTMAVIAMTSALLCSGRRHVLRMLLRLHDMIARDEGRHILNSVFITDMCIWVQTLSDEALEKLGSAVRQLPMCPADAGLDLDTLDSAMDWARQEEDGADPDDDSTDSDDESDDDENQSDEVESGTTSESGEIDGSEDEDDAVEGDAAVAHCVASEQMHGLRTEAFDQKRPSTSSGSLLDTVDESRPSSLLVVNKPASPTAPDMDRLTQAMARLGTVDVNDPTQDTAGRKEERSQARPLITVVSSTESRPHASASDGEASTS